ncbi:Hypothetical protein AT6N2_L0060 [Agrobacterium tumefaciens]|nr:Hypothetical protein AT6N2_L0060 [Agrobacterium tumefaciens]
MADSGTSCHTISAVHGVRSGGSVLRGSGALDDVADPLTDDVLIRDLPCLNIEDGVNPHAGAFLPGHDPQGLDSAAATRFLMCVDSGQFLVDLDTGKAFRRHGLCELLQHRRSLGLGQLLP